MDSFQFEETGELKEKEKSPALQKVLDDLSIAEAVHNELRPKWKKYRDKYMCILEGNVHRNEIYDPETFAAVETVTPRILNSIFSGPEVWSVKPTGMEDVENARKNEQLLNYQTDRMNMYSVSGDVIRDSLVVGTGFSKLYWNKEIEPAFEIQYEDFTDPMTGLPDSRPKYAKTWRIKSDDPKNDRISIEDLFFDPDATSIDNAKFIIHRTWRSKDYLKKKQLEGVYSNVDDIKFGGRSVDKFAGKYGNDGSITFIANPDKLMEECEVLEYYGGYDIDNDGYLEECILTIADRSVVLRETVNQLPGSTKPFFSYTPVPVPGTVYGMSMIEPIDKIQDALNDRTNQIADNIQLILNRMWKVNKYAGIDEDQLVSSAGGVIEVNQMSDIEALDVPDIVPSVQMEISRFEGKIQKALGTYDVARGQMPDRQETATTTIALQNVAEIRFKTMAILFDRMYMRKIGNYQLKLNKKYMGPNRQIRVLGNDSPFLETNPQFATISKEEILDDPDIFAVGATTEVGFSKDAQLRQIAQFLQITSNPVFLQNPMFSIDYGALLDRLPYLLNIKLKRPLVIEANPVLAYQQLAQEKQMQDQMIMQAVQSGIPPEMMAVAMQGGGGMPLPSRTKGELAKGEQPQEGENG